MKPTELAIHLERRKVQAAKIVAEPHKFKVCDQCSSIAFKQAGICPVCHAYLFDESPARVEGIAKYNTNFAFPQTAGVVPRLKGDK
jgi:hypothetical protein